MYAQPRGFWLPKSFRFWLLSGGGGGCHFQRGWQGLGLSSRSPSSWVLPGAGGLGQGVPGTSGHHRHTWSHVERVLSPPGEGETWSRPASQPWEAPLGGLGVPGDTPGMQPAGSCLLRGVPSQGHAGWPGNIFGPVCPRHQVPSLIPRCCEGHAGRERVLSPPQKLPCRDLGLVSWEEGTVRGQGPILAPSGRGLVLPSGQAGHYWEYEAKPRSPPEGSPSQSPRNCSGWGEPRSPNPPTALLSLHSSTALGDAGGHLVLPVPCPQHPRVPRSPPARDGPWVPPPPAGLVAPVCLLEQGMVPVEPLSLGLFQRRRVPGCLWGPPCTQEGQGWGTQLEPPRSWPWTPSSTPGGAQYPQTSHGQLWPLSEPPPWGQESQCPPVGDAGDGTAAGTGPTHCPTLRLLARTAQEVNIWRAGRSGSTSFHHPHPLGMGMEKGEAEM